MSESALINANRLRLDWLRATPWIVKEHVRRMSPRTANALDGVITIDPAGVAVVPNFNKA